MTVEALQPNRVALRIATLAIGVARLKGRHLAEARMSTPIREWPALMDLGTAGAYLTLAPGSLIALLRRENIAPVDVGARLKRWRRQDLDALIERLPRSGPPAPERRTLDPEDDADTALARVERRTARRRKPMGRRPDEIRQPHPAP